MLTLRFDDGTLLISDPGEAAERLAPWCVHDRRVGAWRAPARHYAMILRALHNQIPYNDLAKTYTELHLTEGQPLPLRPYQEQALAAWQANKRQGVVVLPTGAGKTYVAVKAMLACRRSCVVVTPTIDLVNQWVGELERRLGCPIGQYGGGERNLQDITVSTYDSACLFMPHHGHRFGLLICDECHHLPAEVYGTIAECCLAPFRLGLSATPERDDGLHARLDELLGAEVHRSQITELEGHYLANYQAEVVEVAMDADELDSYQQHRAIYLQFVRAAGINFSAKDGWAQFISACGRASDGRTVMRAYREQKRLMRASRAKLRVCWDLLREHAGERCIVFTDDNATAYDIGRQMVLPVITHHTKGKERKQLLQAFRAGALPVLVTSRVLNEGVDVPEATVGIIISGTGSVREHVQRLGRILRPKDDKVAVLYELISLGTAEAYTSTRRRNHVAFGEESVALEAQV